ncbi:MAG: type II secretion system protein GspK, partial [Sedimentisphaerales bacterium]|nr:type II secretion system protein GspK [Sedimentisphaerales bacterium]
EIGTATVTIEIEDENAKLPLIWGTNSDESKQREVDAAITTFCEWMKMDWQQIDTLKRDLKKIGQLKVYKAGTLKINNTAPAVPADSTDSNAVRKGLTRQGRRRQPQPPPQAQTAKGGVAEQLGSMVRLLHSSMIDTESLAVPYVKTEYRTESTLKYMSRWGATQVNVITAPRQVLEAAFMFGGDASEVADAIIKERQQKPFVDANDLTKKMYKYADSIRKSKDFITTASNVFSVKITAVSGVATVSMTAAVQMQGKKPQILAIMTE